MFARVHTLITTTDQGTQNALTLAVSWDPSQPQGLSHPRWLPLSRPPWKWLYPICSQLRM